MGEAELALLGQLRWAGLPEPVTQYQFARPRKWTFDLAWPQRMVACEVEGGIFLAGGGRHQRWYGYRNDCRKYSEAAILGWAVIRVTSDMVDSGEALAFIERALKGAA